MNKYIVNISAAAHFDLKGIVNYIKDELKSPQSASKLLSSLHSEIISLEKMPYRYNLVADDVLAQRGIRKIPIKNYIVFYITNEENMTVTIIRVLYKRRNWEQLI